jgi:N-acetylmuramic acid 6-phosphate etherase
MSITETSSERYRGLDSWSDAAILDAFAEGQERAIAAVRAATPAIARAANAIAVRLEAGGRIVYVGAGSSGLIAALDGMELGGTFGWPDERVKFVLANGRVLEPGLPGGPEDDAAEGTAAMRAIVPQPTDAVIAVAASGATPFTLAATDTARSAGALTVGIAANPQAPLLAAVDVAIFLDSGPEIVTGSTRMNAGTAQKASLGLLSNLVMIRLGHIHDGHMVNVRIDNQKLRKRALAILADITGCDGEEASRALDRCEGRVKQAALVLRGLTREDAEILLSETKGHLRTALERVARHAGAGAPR